jgi:hypothetical protein
VALAEGKTSVGKARLSRLLARTPVEFRSVNGITQQEFYRSENLNQEIGSLIDTVQVTPLLTSVGGVGALLRSPRSSSQAILLHHVAVIETLLTRALGLFRCTLTRAAR